MAARKKYLTDRSDLPGRLIRLVMCSLPGILAMLVAAWPGRGEAAAPPVLLPGGETRVQTDGTPSVADGSIISLTYFSSVDGAELHYHEYLPAGFSLTGTYPLVLLLPSLGWDAAQYEQDPAWRAAADLHGYILQTVEPRYLPGSSGSRATFYIDGALVPGEQDVLDALSAERARHTIDANRLYIAGFSMGGVGSLNIASQLPGVFAAAAPGAPVSDMFQEWQYSPWYPDFQSLFGGAPGASVVTDSLWYEYSPRFLLPNLMHTPLRIVHGISDTIFPNGSLFPYMQSRHVVDMPGFTDSRGRAITLQELRAVWPSSYYEEHLWPPTDHSPTLDYWRPNEILSFFDAHVLVTSPLTAAFTTYDSKHTHAYWLQLNLVQPSSATPALVYAARDPARNQIALQVTGSLTLTLDLPAMALTSSVPLTLEVAPLGGPGPAGDLSVVLSGPWPSAAYTVRKDGVALPPGAYEALPDLMTLRRQATNLTHTYVFSPVVMPPPVYLPLVFR